MATVQDILDKKGSSVTSVGEDSSVLEAARQMNAERIGAVVVTSGTHVVGIFTERDIMVRVVAAGLDPAGTRVREVMTSPVACCRTTTDLEECRAVMTEKRIRHLPVVENDRLMGIVTAGDVLAHNYQHREQTIAYLHQYILGDVR